MQWWPNRSQFHVNLMLRFDRQTNWAQYKGTVKGRHKENNIWPEGTALTHTEASAQHGYSINAEWERGYGEQGCRWFIEYVEVK